MTTEPTLTPQSYPLWLCVRRGPRMSRHLVVAWQRDHDRGELIPWGPSGGPNAPITSLAKVVQAARSQGHTVTYSARRNHITTAEEN
ncbi:hypothetical protein [Streptosporangium sp. G12]